MREGGLTLVRADPSAVIAGHSASKTRVNALMPGNPSSSVKCFFRWMSAELGLAEFCALYDRRKSGKPDVRVKPAHDGAISPGMTSRT
jgi:hypothetical protein